MALPSDAEDWEAVETLDDFATYVTLLSEAVETDATTISAFLEAFSAWVSDSYLQPGAPFGELRPDPSWREFARMLRVTCEYE
jgi:hypothetical protein